MSSSPTNNPSPTNNSNASNNSTPTNVQPPLDNTITTFTLNETIADTSTQVVNQQGTTDSGNEVTRTNFTTTLLRKLLIYQLHLVNLKRLLLLHHLFNYLNRRTILKLY